jgi:hypothetical protein
MVYRIARKPRVFPSCSVLIQQGESNEQYQERVRKRAVAKRPISNTTAVKARVTIVEGQSRRAKCG